MQTSAKTLSDVPAINRFLSYCRVRTVPSKTVMIHAGDLPDVLYYIVDGSVEVMIEDEDGNEMVLAYLNKGPVLRRDGPLLQTADAQRLGAHANGMRDRRDDLPAVSANRKRKPRPGVRARNAASDASRPDQSQAGRPGFC